MIEGGAAPLLEVRGLAKRFTGVVALKGVDLCAVAGEVHALVGANGAGKSTLMTLLSGAQSPSEGEIKIDGRPVRFTGPASAQAIGIATVYQEFSLVPQLSVARNIFLGREPKGAFGLVDRQRLIADTRVVLDRFGLDLDPEAEVSTLSVAQQQIVEIARALSLEARILILDEPTAVLSLAEQEKLFAIIGRLKARGVLVLYVSHHLREVLAIADRVTVLRDGEKIATRDVAAVTLDEIIELMVGKSGAYATAGGEPARRAARAAFRVAYRTGGRESVLEIGEGEIVGLAGLVGSGRTVFARTLAGSAWRGALVEIEHGGERLRVSSPREAMGHGILYLTEDRKRDGVFAELDIIANATASALPAFGFGPFRQWRKERAAAAATLKRLRLVAEGLDQPVVRLSGGNQQKVVIARALIAKPKLLVCDEPTRGVDVGAKAEIHEILRELARQGVAVLVISSETEELLALASRIVVMRERRFVADLQAREADEARILTAASGGGASRETS